MKQNEKEFIQDQNKNMTKFGFWKVKLFFLEYYHLIYVADNNGVKYFEIQSYNETKKLI